MPRILNWNNFIVFFGNLPGKLDWFWVAKLLCWPRRKMPWLLSNIRVQQRRHRLSWRWSCCSPPSSNMAQEVQPFHHWLCLLESVAVGWKNFVQVVEFFPRRTIHKKNDFLSIEKMHKSWGKVCSGLEKVPSYDFRVKNRFRILIKVYNWWAN